MTVAADPILCVFARVPRLGAVKRRLARDLGDALALEAHRVLVADTLGRLSRMPGLATELWIDGPPDADCRKWSRDFGVPLRQQQGADLGQRMAHALTDGLQRASRALLVGTDCPPIDAAYVRGALRALDDHPVVLGPAADGGYGLIGVRERVPALFDRIGWGGPDVLRQTLAAAAARGIAVALCEEIWDVDDAADWARYLASVTAR